MWLLVFDKLHPFLLLYRRDIWLHQLSRNVGRPESGLRMRNIDNIIVGYFGKLRVAASSLNGFILSNGFIIVFLHNIWLLNGLARKLIGVLDLCSCVPAPCNLLNIHIHNLFVFAVIVWPQIIFILLIEI